MESSIASPSDNISHMRCNFTSVNKPPSASYSLGSPIVAPVQTPDLGSPFTKRKRPKKDSKQTTYPKPRTRNKAIGQIKATECTEVPIDASQEAVNVPVQPSLLDFENETVPHVPHPTLINNVRRAEEPNSTRLDRENNSKPESDGDEFDASLSAINVRTLSSPSGFDDPSATPFRDLDEDELTIFDLNNVTVDSNLSRDGDCGGRLPCHEQGNESNDQAKDEEAAAMILTGLTEYDLRELLDPEDGDELVEDTPIVVEDAIEGQDEERATASVVPCQERGIHETDLDRADDLTSQGQASKKYRAPSKETKRQGPKTGPKRKSRGFHVHEDTYKDVKLPIAKTPQYGQQISSRCLNEISTNPQTLVRDADTSLTATEYDDADLDTALSDIKVSIKSRPSTASSPTKTRSTTPSAEESKKKYPPFSKVFAPDSPDSLPNFLKALEPVKFPTKAPRTPQPFRPRTFPKPVTDSTAIMGLNSTEVLRVCFRIGEAINASILCSRSGKQAIIELYARVASSERGTNNSASSHVQTFEFLDLFTDDAPALRGTWSHWKGVDLWDTDAAAFLAREGKKICRVVGRILPRAKREVNAGHQMVVQSIWCSDWEDVKIARGAVEFGR